MFDVLGNVPVAGELFDRINGLVYLGRRDKLNATPSFSAMIPIVGTGLKYGVKGVAKGGKDIFQFTDTTAKHMDELGRMISVQILDDIIKAPMSS